MSERALHYIAPLIAAALLALHLPAAAQNDPTQPPAGYGAPSAAAAGAQVEPPRITAILRAASRRLALIDGEFAGVGDTVSGARVLRIESDHVLLRMNNQTIRVGVTEPDIRRRPTSGER